MRRAALTVGLGFGDEGKGATVDFLVRHLEADLVVRYCGGPQCGHNVQLPDGRHHTFSQFGSGTFAGAATYLGPHVIVDPVGLHYEAAHLRDRMSIEPYRGLYVDEKCLVTTAYHKALNRLKEISRCDNRHGSCGLGVGETRAYALQHGPEALRAGDLNKTAEMMFKLTAIQKHCKQSIEELELPKGVDPLINLSIDMLHESPENLAAHLREMSKPMQITVGPVGCNRAVVFEGAQGVLLDEWYGFHPYTTYSTVTLHHATELMHSFPVDEVTVIGVTRAYATRHGAGPFPSYSAALTEQISDPGNPKNNWQGSLRCGWLDFELLRYAKSILPPLDALAVNCLDQFPEVGRMVPDYAPPDGRGTYTIPTSKARDLGIAQTRTNLVSAANPWYLDATADEVVNALNQEIAPVAITAKGSTWEHRRVKNLSWRPVKHLFGD